ncbi:unnamed protein product [Rhizophagus irregularis]|nr:unnamed protein product [Rhizophagus irregularis]
MRLTFILSFWENKAKSSKRSIWENKIEPLERSISVSGKNMKQNLWKEMGFPLTAFEICDVRYKWTFSLLSIHLRFLILFYHQTNDKYCYGREVRTMMDEDIKEVNLSERIMELIEELSKTPEYHDRKIIHLR